MLFVASVERVSQRGKESEQEEVGKKIEDRVNSCTEIESFLPSKPISKRNS